MSQHMPRTTAVRVMCPRCMAAPEEPCRGTRDRQRDACHIERYLAAEKREQQAQQDELAARREARDAASRPAYVPPWCTCPRDGSGELCNGHVQRGIAGVTAAKAMLARIRASKEEDHDRLPPRP